MFKIRYLIFSALFLILLFLGFSYWQNKQTKETILYYLPQLEKYELHNIRFKKIETDPSFIFPYAVLISFKTETPNIIRDLGLKEKNEIDTVALKSVISLTQYEHYFTLFSGSESMSRYITEEQNNTKWWKPTECHSIFASPYVGHSEKKFIVRFGEYNNGRIACCKNADVYYILIEYWG